MRKPKAYIRPDDKEVFSLDEDGKTYSLELMKKEFPKSHRFKYTEAKMIECGFKPRDI